MLTTLGFNKESKLWAIAGIVMITSSSIAWLFTQNNYQKNNQEIKASEPNIKHADNYSFPIDLGAFMNLVLPYHKEAAKAASVGKHGAEFRAKSFITQQGKNWTIQLMSVEEEKVINSYLSKKADHANYNYFKYIEPKKPAKYILTYGNFSNVQIAYGALKTYKFDLPVGLKPTTKRFDEYVNYTSDNSGDELVLDRTQHQVRSIVLHRLSEQKMSVEEARTLEKDITENNNDESSSPKSSQSNRSATRVVVNPLVKEADIKDVFDAPVDDNTDDDPTLPDASQSAPPAPTTTP